MEQTNLRDHILRYGLLMGLAEILIVLLTYLMGVKYMASYWTSIINLLVMLLILIASGVKWKRWHNGVLMFKHAFLILFSVYAISGAMLLLFNITLYNTIDPSLPGELHEEIADKMIGAMEKMGTPDDAIDEALSRLDALEDAYKPEALMISYCWSLIFGALIASILAAIIKKKPPEIGTA